MYLPHPLYSSLRRRHGFAGLCPATAGIAMLATCGAATPGGRSRL